jgi:hypothetical protein
MVPEIRLQKTVITHHDVISPADLSVFDVSGEHFQFMNHIVGMVHPFILFPEL